MIDYDQRFFDLAKHIATWSKDSSRKTGAVIIDKDRTVVSLGYNGFVRGLQDDIPERQERPLRYMFAVHAETNAILNASRHGRPLHGCIIYCTFFPCNKCAKAIIQSGITHVVSPEPELDNPNWGESVRVSLQMFSECKIELKYI